MGNGFANCPTTCHLGAVCKSIPYCAGHDAASTAYVWYPTMSDPAPVSFPSGAAASCHHGTHRIPITAECPTIHASGSTTSTTVQHISGLTHGQILPLRHPVQQPPTILEPLSSPFPTELHPLHLQEVPLSQAEIPLSVPQVAPTSQQIQHMSVIPSLQISHSVNPHSVPGVSASHVPGVSASHVPVVTASRVPVVSASPVPVVSASLVKVSEPMMKCLLLLFMVTIVTGNTSCYGTWLCCIYPL